MATKKCTGCGKDIGDQVQTCPHCGQQNITPYRGVLIIVQAVLYIAAMAYLLPLLWRGLRGMYGF